MSNYTIYHKNFVPPKMAEKYPTPAIYQKVYNLYCETYESITGNQPSELVNISSQGLQENDVDPLYIDDNRLKKADLDLMIDGLMQGAPRGREIRLSKAQGKHLQTTKFKK
jgi:hypothetical protein